MEQNDQYGITYKLVKKHIRDVAWNDATIFTYQLLSKIRT